MIRARALASSFGLRWWPTSPVVLGRESSAAPCALHSLAQRRLRSVGQTMNPCATTVDMASFLACFAFITAAAWGMRGR